MDEAEQAWRAAVAAVQQLRPKILAAAQAQRGLSPAQLEELKQRVGEGACTDVAACAAVLGMARGGPAEVRAWLEWSAARDR